MRAGTATWTLILMVVGMCATPTAAAVAAPDETEALAGVLVSPIWASRLRSTFNYAGVFVRSAWPVSWAGRQYAGWDWVGELFVCDVVNGFGHFLGGPSLLVRREWAGSADRWRPYVQGGSGVLYADAYRNPTQMQLGEAVEFRTSLGGGIRRRLSPHWSLAGELMFNHISSGGLSGRNRGVSALGAGLGVSRSF